MKKEIIIGMALTSLMLLVGCKNELEEELTEMSEFCNSLTLKDYYWDCSSWTKSDIENIPNPYTVKCSFESETFNIRSQCAIKYYLSKEGVENIWTNDVEWCQGETLKGAFDYCKKGLPKELDGIKIIEPTETP
jgi:hypothetical protein